jgi:hypothetical protein
MTISRHYNNIIPPKIIKLLMVTEAPPLFNDIKQLILGERNVYNPLGSW